MKKKIYLTYPKDLVKEALIYEAGKRFNVVTNIRQASISDEIGLVALELEGNGVDVDKAINFFVEKGIKVEPIEMDIIE